MLQAWLASIKWPYASPSVPASRFHTAIHGVRLCLAAASMTAVSPRSLYVNPNLPTQRANPLQAGNVSNRTGYHQQPMRFKRGTHPAKTFRWHRAIGLQFRQPRQRNASTRFERYTLERLLRFSRIAAVILRR